jgi:hypothetical protein
MTTYAFFTKLLLILAILAHVNTDVTCVGKELHQRLWTLIEANTKLP